MKITNAMIMEKLESMDARITALEELKKESKGKTTSTKKSTKKASTKKAEDKWDGKKYDEFAKAVKCVGKNCRCYSFARPLANAYANGEITLDEAKKQFKGLEKPEWFKA